MIDAKSTSFGALWREWGEVSERHGSLLIGAMTTLVAIEFVINLVAGRWANTVSNVIDVVALVVVTVALMRADRLVEREGHAGTYVVVTLLAGGGALLCLIALVVPGLYLLARWSLAQPLAIARGRGPIEAMRESWHLTRGDAWTLVGLFVMFGLAAAAVLLVVGFVATKLFGSTSAFAAVGLLAIVNNVILVSAACLGVAIYRQLVADVTPDHSARTIS